MQRVKRRIFSGAVCEQVVFTVSDRSKDLDKAEPRLRVKTEEERAAHKLGISRRKHARIIDNNFGPTSLYSPPTISWLRSISTAWMRLIKEMFIMEDATHGLLGSRSEEFSRMIHQIAEQR